MKKQNLISFLFFFNSLIVCAQEYNYFNNIYNPINTYASGRGILQVDSIYYGIFGTWEASDYYYKLGVFKMDLTGNLIDWNIIGEDGHDYWSGSLGGTLIRTNDGNLAFATPVSDPVLTYSVLIKLTLELDTLWKREYHSEVTIPQTRKVSQTSEGGYIMVGVDYPGGTYYDGLLLKADTMGIEQWRQIFGIGTIYSEYLTNVIETPDGGYLIGGMRKETEYLDHTLDAMLIKTDSLGNEQWTHTYGNPYVDDDMALVAMAVDGNYIVATVYGEWIFSPETRVGKLLLMKIDTNGNTIWEKKIGPNRISLYIKNLRKLNDSYLLSGFSKETDSATFQYNSGWMMKLDCNLDSVWYRDYIYQDENWENFFYDAYPATDNGYIAIGQSRPDMGGNNNIWIVKVDSMGCDTPGCFTTVINDEIFSNSGGKLIIWPNPSKDKIMVNLLGLETTDRKEKHITIYNSQGLKIECLNIPDLIETINFDVSDYTNGLYFIQYIHSDQIMETVKFIKN